MRKMVLLLRTETWQEVGSGESPQKRKLFILYFVVPIEISLISRFKTRSIFFKDHYNQSLTIWANNYYSYNTHGPFIYPHTTVSNCFASTNINIAFGVRSSSKDCRYSCKMLNQYIRYMQIIIDENIWRIFIVSNFLLIYQLSEKTRPRRNASRARVFQMIRWTKEE